MRLGYFRQGELAKNIRLFSSYFVSSVFTLFLSRPEFERKAVFIIRDEVSTVSKSEESFLQEVL